MATVVAPARSGSLDLRQLRALVRLYVAATLRPGRDAATGKVSTRPVRTLAVGGVLYGVGLAASVDRYQDLRTFLYMMFTSVFVLAAVTVAPDTVETRRRNFDVLGSKPIADLTLIVAQGIAAFSAIAVQAAALSIPQLAAAVVVFRAHPLQLLAVFCSLLLGAFGMVVLWQMLMFCLAQFLHVETVRRINLYLLVIVLLSLSINSILLLGEWGGLDVAATRQISAASVPWARLLPPAWFADFFVAGLDTVSNLERVAALMFLIVPAIMVSRLAATSAYRSFVESLLTPADSRPTRPLSVRVLAYLSKAGFVTRQLITVQALAVARLVLTDTARQDSARVNSAMGRGLLVVLAGGVAATGQYRDWTVLLITFSFLDLVSGANIVTMSTSPEASWLLRATPLRPETIVRGARLAMLTRYFGLPAAVGAFVLYSGHRFELATILFASYLVSARAVAALLLALRTTLPLSQEQSPTSVTTAFAITVLVSVASTVGYYLQIHLYSGWDPWGLPACALVFVALLRLDGYLIRWASRSLARREEGLSPAGSTAVSRKLRPRRSLPATLARTAILLALCTGALAALAGGPLLLYQVASTSSIGARAMISLGSDVNGIRRRRTPLLHAIVRGDEETARVLLELGADPNGAARQPGYAAPTTPVLEAIHIGRPELVSSLLAFGLDPDGEAVPGTPALHYALRSGQADVAIRLLAAGADPNQADGKGGIPLGYAVALGEISLVDELLDKGANPSALHSRRPVLVVAASTGMTDAARLLASRGARFDESMKRKVLRSAVVTVGVDELRILIEAGAEVDAADADGRRPIMEAALAGSWEVVWLLIHRGASASAPDARGRTPIHEAAWSRVDSAKKILVLTAAGASVREVDKDGVTPLMCAAMRGNGETMEALESLGASATTKDKRGWTSARYMKAMMVGESGDLE